jgi:hypothetical protein
MVTMDAIREIMRDGGAEVGEAVVELLTEIGLLCNANGIDFHETERGSYAAYWEVKGGFDAAELQRRYRIGGRRTGRKAAR